MATTFVEYTGDGNATKQFTFPSYQESDVKVRVDGVLKTTSTHYNITSYTTTGGGNVVFTSGNIPSSPAKIRIYRDTSVDAAKATFTAGASVKAADLNNNNTQLLYRAQEEQVPNLIQTFDINDDAITSAKIDDSTIVEGNLANSSVTQNKLANNSVGTPEIINGSVTTLKIAADAVDGTKIADNAIDSEHYVDGSIDRQHLETDIIDSTRLADNAVNSEHYVDGSIDHVHLANDIIDGDNIQDDVINSEHIAAGALDNEHYATGSITSNKLSDATVVTNSEQASHNVNDTSFFTTAAAEARYFSTSTGETIKDGQSFPDNDTTIATTAAINDRIIDLVDDVGGFVPIANETSFPTANPDVNNGTGTIVSVSAASTNLVPSGTTVTIANGAGTGNTVTITGVSATIPSGFGFLVETTTTLHTYTFHRLSPKATEVTTVATNATQVQTVHTNITNINTVAGDISNVNTVAGDATEINALAAKTTELGLLGTAAVVEDLGILGTADVVSDLNTLGTADVVADMNLLATSDVISDMNTLAVTDVINDMDTVATNVTNVNNVGGSIASVNTAAANLNSINNFGDTYQVAANNPTTDGGGNALAEGDLYFNTSANRLKVYDGANWVNGVEISGSGAVTTGNTFTGDNRYNDNVKALFGTGSDLEIFHDGGNSRIVDVGNGKLMIDSNGAGTDIRKNASENMAKFITDGAAELYYDNSKKFETTSTGISVTGVAGIDNSSSTSDVGLRVTNNSTSAFSTSEIIEGTTNRKLTPLMLRNGGATANTETYLGFDAGNTSKSQWNIGIRKTSALSGDFIFNTRTGSATSAQRLKISHGGDLVMPNDNAKLQIGAGQDLDLYHNGSNSFISNSTGSLALDTASNEIQLNKGTSEYMGRFITDGAVELYHNGNKKFETTSTGATVTGNLDVSSGVDVTGGITATGLSTFSASGSALRLNDDSILRLGNEDADFFMYYQGSSDYGYISTGTNRVLRITTNDLQVYDANNTEQLFRTTKDSATQLFYDSNLKLATNSTGITTTGRLNQQVNSSTVYPYSNFGNNAFTAYDHELIIDNNTTGNEGSFAGIYFNAGADSDGSKVGTARISAVEKGNYAADLVFGTRNVSFTEKLIIKANGRLQLPHDDQELQIGAGQDLKLYHDGTDSFIKNSTGVLRVNSDNIYLKDKDNGDMFIQCLHDAGVQLRYDNSAKLETTNDGVTITGDLTVTDDIFLQDNLIMGDTDIIYLGDGSDLQIQHSGSNSFVDHNGAGDLYLRANGSGEDIYIRAADDIFIQPQGGEDGIKVIGNGGVQLYEDNALKFVTGSGGEYGSVEAKTGKNGWSGFTIGGYYAFMANNEGNADTTGIYNDLDNEWMVKLIRNGSAQLFHNGNKKLETQSDGVTCEAEVFTMQSTADVDLVLSADTDNSDESHVPTIQFKSDGGTTKLKIGVEGSAGDTFTGSATNTPYILNVLDAGIQIGTNNTARWTWVGAGHFLPETNNAVDIGSASQRVRNIYTNDLNLSNEGSSNDVDGTWGDWTIQEGESDLFLKNNRSGKKYKFNLMEVS